MTPSASTEPVRVRFLNSKLHFYNLPYTAENSQYCDKLHLVVRLGLSRQLAPEFVAEHFGTTIRHCVRNHESEFWDKNWWRGDPTHFPDNPGKAKEVIFSYSKIFVDTDTFGGMFAAVSLQRSVQHALSTYIHYEAKKHRCAEYHYAVTRAEVEKHYCLHCGEPLKNTFGNFCVTCGKELRTPQPQSDPVPAQRPLIIPESVRNQHIYIPGKTRHGKSTLIHKLAYSDIKNGGGVCVIDPKGDLVTSLLKWVPDSRRDDCIYIDPHDPVPMDFLDFANQREKQTLVGELKYVITRGVNTESAPLMNSMLNDVIYTILDANDHGLEPRATFLDIHDFLAFKGRRDKIMRYVKSERLRERWNESNFPNPKERQPALTRMNDYVNSDYLNKIFGCPKPELNISRVMDERKILLVNLGGIDEPTKIFATLLIAKLRQAAFRRHNIPESERIPFHLYVDEFEFFQTSDFDQILSFAGGYGLRLTLANQFIGQLDPNIRQSILGNVGTFIIFCLSPGDAHHFKHILPPPPFWAKYLPELAVEAVKIENLPKYKALYAIAGQEPFVEDTPDPPPEKTESNAEYIRKRTLERYGCKSPQVVDTAGEGKVDPERNVLSDEKQTAGPSSARGVFRPSEPRPSRPVTRKDSQPKRPPNDKPDP